MADVEISYNDSIIASLSDSGSEILDTKGKFMADNITVTYEKSGAISLSTVSIQNIDVNYVYYTDENMEPQTTSTDITALMPVGSLVVTILNGAPEPAPFVPVYNNLLQIASYSCSNSRTGQQLYVKIYKVLASS